MLRFAVKEQRANEWAVMNIDNRIAENEENIDNRIAENEETT